MKHRFKKTKISKELLERYKQIKPIKWEYGKPVYYPEMQDFHLEEIDYRYMGSYYIENRPVDIQLVVLGDYKITLPADPGSRFKITYAQAINCIPKTIISKVVAFELIYIAQSMLERKIFLKEFEQNEYVAVLRLYKEKAECDEPATQPKSYPDFTIDTPIGMSKEEAENIRATREYMDRRGLY